MSEEIRERSLPEAGGVAWTTMLTAMGQSVNLTARGETLIEAIDGLNDGVVYAHEKYQWTGVASVNVQKGYKAKPGNPSAPQQREVQTVSNEDEAVPGETGESIVAQYQVSVRPDGKTELNLYEAGHKYPDLRVVGWDITSLSKLLGNVQSLSGKDWEQAIQDGEQGMMQWLIKWEYSDKLKKTGKPYQNVKEIWPYNP